MPPTPGGVRLECIHIKNAAKPAVGKFSGQGRDHTGPPVRGRQLVQAGNHDHTPHEVALTSAAERLRSPAGPPATA